MKPDNILVIKLSALGDFILSFAAFAAIRAHHPHARITLLTTTPYADLARRSGWFNTVQIDTRPKWYQLKKMLSLRKSLRSQHYSRVYDLQVNDRTALYHRLLGTKPNWSGADFKHSNHDIHAFDLRRAQLQQAGIADTPLPDLAWLDSDIAHFKLPERFVLICAGAAPHRAGKRWSPRHYAALCTYLLQQQLTPVLLGTAHEKIINSEIVQTVDGVIDLTGQTSLFDIGALVRHAQGAVGNDTGPMHLIAACGCPTLSLFSHESDPARSRPIGAHTSHLQINNLDDLKPETVIAALLLR